MYDILPNLRQFLPFTAVYARLAGPWASEDSSVSASQPCHRSAGITYMCAYVFLHRLSKVQTQVLILSRQVFYPLSHPPSRTHSLKEQCNAGLESKWNSERKD